MRSTVFWAGGLLLVLVLTACGAPKGAGPVAAPREARRGAPPAALTRLPAAAVPDLRAPLRGYSPELLAAVDRSLGWFDRSSVASLFPVAGIDYVRAYASVYAFRELLLEQATAAELTARMRAEFDVYASRGVDGDGQVLFTGYYAPVFEASREPTEEFRYPLYRRPGDLVTDTLTGEVLGRRTGEGLEPYPTRAQLQDSRVLEGRELVWLKDLFDVYLIQVQGSALLELRDGSRLPVSYDGSNGRPYTSIARLLVREGELTEAELSVPNLRAYFRAHPGALRRYLRHNDRFVFFREGDLDRWPQGSLGVKVTPLRTLATDKGIFPAGGVVLVETDVPDGRGGLRRFRGFMLDQDAGGAIRSPGRADIYFGVGPEAGALAGRQYSTGRLYYFFLKPERVAFWWARLQGR